MPRRTPPVKVTPRWASLNHAAEYYDCSRTTIRRLIANGDLPAHKVAGTKTIRIDLNDVDALCQRIPSRQRAS